MTDNRRNTNTFTGEQELGIGEGTPGSRWGVRAATSGSPDDATRGHGSGTPQRERTTQVQDRHNGRQRDPTQGPASDIGGGPHRTQVNNDEPRGGHPPSHDLATERGETRPAEYPLARHEERRATNGTTELFDPRPQRRRPHKRTHKGKKNKGALKLASLNMKGGGSASTESKWEQINQLMRDERIDILALQETHMTTPLRDRMNEKYGMRVHILSSALDDSPNAAGVAVVLNKQTTRWKEATFEEVVNGRAILVQVPWCENLSMRVLAVYAPNPPRENATFWETLQTKCNERDDKPNCLLGDFNVVEDSVDRSPAHEDNANQTQALMNLKSSLSVADGWRRENPTKIDYSFKMEGRNITSRIDRVYIKEDLIPFTNGWDITRTGIKTDHSMVTMEVMNPWLPHQGTGRYAMPVYILEQKKLMKKIQRLGKEHMSTLERLSAERTAAENPQTAHKKFKTEIIRVVREHAKLLTPQIDQRISHLKAGREHILNNEETPEEERRNEASLIDEKIRDLEIVKFGRVRDKIAANFFLEGEVMGKPWIRANKELKARDMIIAQRDTRIPERPVVRKTKTMAEIMRHHHDNLQTKDSPEGDEDYREHVEHVLSHLDLKLDDSQKSDLDALLQEEDVKGALNSLPEGKAAGLDGIINELWKKLSRTFDNDSSRPTKQSFDIVKALTMVFQDIQTNGISDNTNFAEGWMCPIYKKGDRAEPGNYRPITVLNTDYKIYTKALSMKLTKVAPTLIHHDQAGFMVGRRIEDQTELARLMIDWAEMTETNGMIVCLDQEKAYDKILHNFLWETLRTMGFPESFINSIRAVYTGATTVVMLNGEFSIPFLVIRGVRQGDPLSCLLFNLAIESLAQMLRKSDLKGLSVSDALKRVITTLFADDTTVYMSEEDSFHDLENILRSWCRASGGKFNVPKTVITPVGTETFRNTMFEARTNRIPLAPIPDNIHIARDGEATRLLGAFIGNNAENPGIWTPTTERITREFGVWSRGNPTIKGRRLIANMIVGGLTQYRTCVQGMSKEIEEKMTTQMRKFIWNSEATPAINTQTLTRPVEEGGLQLLDIKARNEAIDLMRLKRYLNLKEDRPQWAYVADEILRRAVTRDSRVSDEWAFQNPFLQTIKINTRAGEKKLPASLKKMVTSARKHKVRFTPLLLAPELMEKMPLWFHPGLADKKRIQYNAVWAKCMRQSHRIRTVGDAVTFQQAFIPDKHEQSDACQCRTCTTCRGQGCTDPNRCKNKSEKLVSLLGNRWNPTSPAIMRTLTDRERSEHQADPAKRTFDPDFTTRGSLTEGFRAFTNEDGRVPTSVIYPKPPPEAPNARTTVYTDGSSTLNGTVIARAGAGLWFGRGDNRNRAERVPEIWEQTNNTGEAWAIALASTAASEDTDLTIRTDSKITMDGLTDHLTTWEDRGWIGVANKEILRYAAGALRKRAGRTTFEKVKGHSGIEGNEAADRLADEGARKPAQPGPPHQVELPEYQNVGVKLSEASQALLYKGIKESEKVKERRQTVINLDKTRWAVDATGGGPPTDERIWKSLGCKTLTKEARAFQWRSMHGGYKLGEYWENIAGYEDRAECPHCRVTETMEHILTECEVSGQAQVWTLTEELFRTRGVNWKRPSLGDILGCQMITPGTTTGDNKAASRRFNTIIMSESARTIWKMRCHWRIEKESAPDQIPSNEHAKRKWAAAITRRVKLDCQSTTATMSSRRATPKHLVEATWAHLIPEGHRVQNAWEGICRVLVGIG